MNCTGEVGAVEADVLVEEGEDGGVGVGRDDIPSKASENKTAGGYYCSNFIV